MKHCFLHDRKYFHFFLQCKETETIAADGIDNDCDGQIDEEVRDGKDNDGDGKVDEDLELVNEFYVKYILLWKLFCK